MAAALWARYPTEIEFDLSHEHHRHIREWHQGQMSSRELLVLIVNQPEDGDSAYQRERRDGDWTVHQHIAKTTANALLDLNASSGGEGYVPEHFQSPAEMAAEEAEAEADEWLDDERDHVEAQLHGETT
jgi:hypothetical protein